MSHGNPDIEIITIDDDDDISSNLDSVSSQPAAGNSFQKKLSSSETSFLDALIVPDLAQICGRALDSGWNGAGTGLKKLRLLSHGVKDAAQKAVQGFALELGGESQLDTPRLLEFLKHSRLLSLRISTALPPVKRTEGEAERTQDAACFDCIDASRYVNKWRVAQVSDETSPPY